MYTELINALSVDFSTMGSMGLVPLFALLFMVMVIVYGAMALKDDLVPDHWGVNCLPVQAQPYNPVMVGFGLPVEIEEEEWDEEEEEEVTVPYWDVVTGEWSELTFDEVMAAEPYEAPSTKEDTYAAAWAAVAAIAKEIETKDECLSNGAESWLWLAA